jgi:hypothetical protein
MSARLLATFCLLSGLVAQSPAGAASSQDSTLAVYLRTGGNQPAAPLEQMKRELSSLMHQAGSRVEWRSLDSEQRDTTDAAYLAVLELNGTCGLAAGHSVATAGDANLSSLATTSVSDGQVLPFSTVNCAVVTRSVAPALMRESGAQRDFLYGRAMARVVAHELYHVLLKTADHAHAGIARSCFTAEDLLTEHFEFEGATLAKLRTESVAVASDDATDR